MCWSFKFCVAILSHAVIINDTSNANNRKPDRNQVYNNEQDTRYKVQDTRYKIQDSLFQARGP